MTNKELEEYDKLINKGIIGRHLTPKEEKRINELGKKSVEARKRNNSNK